MLNSMYKRYKTNKKYNNKMKQI